MEVRRGLARHLPPPWQLTHACSPTWCKPESPHQGLSAWGPRPAAPGSPGNRWKCRISGPASNLLNQKLQGWDPAMVSTKPTWGLRCTLPFKATIQGPEDHLKRWSLMSGGAGRSVSVTSGGSSNGVQWGPQCPPRLDRVTQVPCPQSLSSVTPNPGG